LSDALQRRKAFVLCGAIVYALGFCIIALADSYAMFLAGMAATGIGHGLYFAVDLALVTEVLPDRERDAAKDLGILNITNALPQSVAPALAPLILGRERRRLWRVVLRRRRARARRLDRDPAAENRQIDRSPQDRELVLSWKMYHRCHSVN
jgi:MFS family permease